MRKVCFWLLLGLCAWWCLSHSATISFFGAYGQEMWQTITTKGYPTDYHEMAREAAVQAGFPPTVFVRQIQVESGFNPNAVGARGEVGLCQFLPQTAQARGIDPLDPARCLQAAATWEAQVYHQTGSIAAALAAYNCGNGCLAQALHWRSWGCHIPWSTQHYIWKITGRVIC